MHEKRKYSEVNDFLAILSVGICVQKNMLVQLLLRLVCYDTTCRKSLIPFRNLAHVTIRTVHNLVGFPQYFAFCFFIVFCS